MSFTWGKPVDIDDFIARRRGWEQPAQRREQPPVSMAMIAVGLLPWVVVGLVCLGIIAIVR